MNRQPFLVAVGDNCVDYYVQTRTGYPGGNPVNVSVYFTRLGGRAAYIGAVGTDEGGALICDGLRRKNVDISHIHTVQGRTAVTRVALRDGDRVFLDYNEVVMADFTLTEADMDFLRTADMVVGGISGHGERYFPRIRSDGIPTAFDFSDEYDDPAAATIFPCVEVAFFSYDGGDAAGFLRRMRERGLRRAAILPAGHRALSGGGHHGRGRQLHRRIPPQPAVRRRHPRLHGRRRPVQCRHSGLQRRMVTKKQPRNYPFTASTRAKCDHSPCH